MMHFIAGFAAGFMTAGFAWVLMLWSMERPR